MALSDFRDTFSWQEAVELGPVLVQLAEQLPASEELGLALRLRKVMIDLPGAIAEDLLQDDSYTRRVQIARLAAMLDIIDKVYPALDTGGARTKLEKLADRVGGDRFAEQTPGARKVYLPGGNVHSGPPDPKPEHHASTPTLQPARPESVQVVPAHKSESAERTESDHGDHSEESPAPATKVLVTPSEPASATPAQAAAEQEDHVLPDSVQ